MKKYIYLSILPLLVIMSFPFFASAQNQNKISDIDTQIKNLGGVTTSGTQNTIGAVLGKIINIIVAVVIVVAVIMVLYAGYLYVAKADQEGGRKEANDIILYSAIGLVIVFLAKAIVAFVVNVIQQ